MSKSISRATFQPKKKQALWFIHGNTLLPPKPFNQTLKFDTKKRSEKQFQVGEFRDIEIVARHTQTLKLKFFSTPHSRIFTFYFNKNIPIVLAHSKSPSRPTLVKSWGLSICHLWKGLQGRHNRSSPSSIDKWQIISSIDKMKVKAIELTFFLMAAKNPTPTPS